MLHKIARIQAHFVKTRRTSTFVIPFNSQMSIGGCLKTRDPFEQGNSLCHFLKHSTPDPFPSSLQIFKGNHCPTPSQILMTLGPDASSSSFNPKKNFLMNPEIYYQGILPSSYSPSFHAFTYSRPKGFATTQETNQDNDRETQTNLSQKDVQDIIDTINDPKKVLEIFDHEGRLQKKNPLAKKLFEEGISPAELSPSLLQNRFVTALNSKGKLVFYPTGLTSEIFRTFLTKRIAGCYITSQKGLGKSFSIALFTYLMRMIPTNRVLYINNPQHILGNSQSLKAEIQFAFSKELENNEVLRKKLNLAFASGQKDSHEFLLGRFLEDLKKVLELKDFKLFIIFDQVNFCDNLSESTNPADLTAYNLYRTIKLIDYSKTTRILVSSATNEMMTRGADQEFPEIVFFPHYLPEGIGKRIISDDLEMDINNEFVKKVYEITAGLFLLVKDITSKIDKQNLEEDLRIITNAKILDIKNDLQNFLTTDERKRAMMTVYRSLSSQPNFPDKKERNITFGAYTKNLIDRRYIVYRDGYGSISPLHPLVIQALNLLFSDITVVQEMFRLYAKNKLVIGFVFENLLITKLANSRDDIKISMRPLQALKNEFQHIISPVSEVIPIKEGKWDFTKSGLYKPKFPTFPVFDCFISTPTELYAIQITIKITPKRIAKMMHALQIAKEKTPTSQQDTKENRKVDQNSQEVQKFTLELDDERTDQKETLPFEINKRSLDIVEQVYKSSKENKKVLRIVLVSIHPNPVQDKTFEICQKLKAQEEFFLVDVTPSLLNMGFSEDEIRKISKAAQEREM